MTLTSNYTNFEHKVCITRWSCYGILVAKTSNKNHLHILSKNHVNRVTATKTQSDITTNMHEINCNADVKKLALKL